MIMAMIGEFRYGTRSLRASCTSLSTPTMVSATTLCFECVELSSVIIYYPTGQSGPPNAKCPPLARLLRSAPVEIRNAIRIVRKIDDFPRVHPFAVPESRGHSARDRYLPR